MTDDRGSATVWVLVCALVVVAATVVLALVGTAALARRRAATAADSAALAAAGHLIEPPTVACAAARQLATANGASLVRCIVRGGVVTVTTRVEPVGWLRRLGDATGLARAGPANSGAAAKGAYRSRRAAS
jgi:secretion/DNA translocation related TadE-like protein